MRGVKRAAAVVAVAVGLVAGTAGAASAVTPIGGGGHPVVCFWVYQGVIPIYQVCYQS